ncbi:copper chaperone PCu(A)C [Frigidibacter oleivorans]|uniref:copper chaperone PCu(A)C n=1 Tax=Frigidibacter oleivorans TaxID=2487129 RepID=UPI000F8C5F19|nr:copper chaperone PCu(A)C [Frigidibacter oleivorans]
MKLFALLTAAAVAAALPAAAHDGVAVRDAYARSSGAMAKTAAAFMVIENHSDQPDRLISATSDVAERVELHTHKASADGVMQMLKIEDGIAIAPHGEHALARGGDHVMFLGLTRPLAQGDMVEVTLSFERAGEVTVELPVDLNRADAPAMGAMDHGAGHGGHEGHAAPSN